MQQKGPPRGQPSTPSPSMLPLRFDPAWGALVGTFLLAACLAGPIGMALAVIVLIVIAVLRCGKNRGADSSSLSERRADAARRDPRDRSLD